LAAASAPFSSGCALYGACLPLYPKQSACAWQRAAGPPHLAQLFIGAEVRVAPGSDEEPFYEAVVRYAYTVQGQEYEGAQDDLTYVSNAQDAAQAIMARYQVGASVPVYYDPQAPQRALIDRSIRPHHLVGLLLASLLFPLLTAGGLLAILTGLAILAAPGPPPPD
jgi:hypothetical protein